MTLPAKQWITIVDCYPSKKQVQGTFRDGSLVQISVFDTGPAFRWPVKDETWTIVRDVQDTAHWILEARVHTENDLESFLPGDLILDSTEVYDREGTLINSVYFRQNADGHLEALLRWPDGSESILGEDGRAAGFVAGDVKMTAKPEVDSGWMACDGQSLLRTDFPVLFAAIGIIYGADDDLHFNLPNYNGKTIVGAGGAFSLGDFGGEEMHVLSETEMPIHAHGAVTGTGVTATSLTGTGSTTATDTGGGSTGVSTTNSGSLSGTTSGASWNGSDVYSPIQNTTNGGMIANVSGEGVSGPFQFVLSTWHGFFVGNDSRKFNDLAHTHTFSAVVPGLGIPALSIPPLPIPSLTIPALPIPALSIPALSIASDGGGLGHNNMQPYAVAQYVIKT